MYRHIDCQYHLDGQGLTIRNDVRFSCRIIHQTVKKNIFNNQNEEKDTYIRHGPDNIAPPGSAGSRIS